MPEEEKEGVDQSAIAQAAESEPTQDVQNEAPKEQPQRPISDEEHNWREARRMRELLEEENRGLRAQIAQSSSPKHSEEDDLGKISDDDIITAKQARLMYQKMAKQVAEDAIRTREAQTVDERLQLKYPDFQSVVTKEAIDLLKQQEPELAQSLYALSNDPYAQSVAAYRLIKKTGLAGDSEMARNKQKAIENSKKPASVQTVTKSSSAIGHASMFENGLTPELKKQLQKEMQEAAKRL